MKVRELIIKWGFDVDNTTLKNLEQNLTQIKSISRAVALSLAGIGTAAAYVLTQTGKFEQWQVAFNTMAGSAAEGKQLMEDLKKFTLETPFELPGVIDGTKRLMAYGIAAKDIISTLKVLGNLSAGVGTNKLPNLILALGQVRTKTRLQATEVRQFTEAGIPLTEALATFLQVPLSTVDDLIRAGKVSYQNVFDALSLLTAEGQRFHNLMQMQANTLLGKWAILRKTLWFQLVETGDILKTDVLDSLDKIIKWLNKNKIVIRESLVFIFKEAATYVRVIADFLGVIVSLTIKLLKLVNSFQLSQLFGGLKKISTTLLNIGITVTGLVVSVGMLTGAIKKITGVFTLMRAVLLSTPGLIALALSSLILIVQDMYVYFSNTGGRSITGMIIKFFKEELPIAIKVAMKALFPAITLVEDIGKIIKGLIFLGVGQGGGAFSYLLEAIQVATSMLIKFFKEDLPVAIKVAMKALFPAITLVEDIGKIIKGLIFLGVGQGGGALSYLPKLPKIHTLPGVHGVSSITPPLQGIANLFVNKQKPNGIKNNNQVTVHAPVNIAVNGGDAEEIKTVLKEQVGKIFEDKFNDLLDTTDGSIEDQGDEGDNY